MATVSVQIHRRPPVGHQVASELAAAGLARPCPTSCTRSTVPHIDGVCVECGRPWTETTAAELGRGAA